MRCGAASRVLVVALLVAGLAGCSGVGEENAEKPPASSRSEAPTTCPAAAHSDLEEGLELARAVIEAAQKPDLAGICELIGRKDIPDGVLRYNAAIRDGLTTDIEYIEAQPDPASKTEAYRFGIPDAQASQAVLGLAFQRQSAGWVLLMAPFFPRE